VANSEGDPVDAATNRPAAPARRGSREDRREATVRALASDKPAHCAYCGRRLPPIPPQGGRPTPYCPPDPDRYGRWGAKVITCAMLDEHREIWVGVYGPDQPMTALDTRVLDAHLADALTALDPLTTQLTSLRAQVNEHTTAALTARADAEAARDAALEQARTAQTDRVVALDTAARAAAQAEMAREQAEADRTAARAAQVAAAQAAADRAAAFAARDKAEHTRQQALAQVSTTQDRVGALQAELAGERATTLERLEQARHDADRAQQNLRTTLTTQHESRLREQAEEFDTRARASQTAADHRVSELVTQLALATRSYADTLEPLHGQLGVLRAELAIQTATATDLRHRLDQVHTMLDRALEATDPEQLRRLVAAVLDRPEPNRDPDQPVDGSAPVTD
jgi:chromosome segregation ATPase